MSSECNRYAISDSSVSSSDDHSAQNLSLRSRNCVDSESSVSSSDDRCLEAIASSADTLMDDDPVSSSVREPMEQLMHLPEMNLLFLADKYMHETDLESLNEVLEHLPCSGCEQLMCERMRQLWQHKHNCRSSVASCGIKLFFSKLTVFHIVDCDLEDCSVDNCNEVRTLIFRCGT